jgi:multidrug efflux pump subunit AcrA (membrane-fusion protein)
MRFIIPFVIFFLLGCGKDRESTLPTFQGIVEAVYSSVVVEPEGMYKVNASNPGIIAKVYFNEGDTVNVGQAIYLIDNASALINAKNAELNYSLLANNVSEKVTVIEEMKIELRTAKIKLKSDSLNYFRYKDLTAKNTIPKVELERMSLLYEQSKNVVASLNKKIVRLENELNNQMAQSKNNLNLSNLKSNDYMVKSEMQGMIYQLLKEKGEYANMQEVIAILGKRNSFKLRMLIDEVDISKVNINQKVLVTLEAYKDKVYEAKVTRIAPKMDEKTQTFTVEAAFINTPPNLYMGLTGEGNIVINEKRKTLVIPREYLQPGNKVETDNGLVTVKIGLTNWDYVEILSGIDEKTKIYMPE